MALPNHHRDPFDRIMIAIELDGLCWIPSVKASGIELEDAGLGLSAMIAGREPNGVDFLAGAGAGRAKLLLSRIPAASAAPISAAPLKRWQLTTTRTSVWWLGRSLAVPTL